MALCSPLSDFSFQHFSISAFAKGWLWLAFPAHKSSRFEVRGSRFEVRRWMLDVRCSMFDVRCLSWIANSTLLRLAKLLAVKSIHRKAFFSECGRKSQWVMTENLDGFPPASSLLRAFVVHSVFGIRISSFYLLPSPAPFPLSGFQCFSISAFSFFLALTRVKVSAGVEIHGPIPPSIWASRLIISNYFFAFRGRLVIGFIPRRAITIEISCLWMRKSCFPLR